MIENKCVVDDLKNLDLNMDGNINFNDVNLQNKMVESFILFIDFSKIATNYTELFLELVSNDKKEESQVHFQINKCHAEINTIESKMSFNKTIATPMIEASKSEIELKLKNSVKIPAKLILEEDRFSIQECFDYNQNDCDIMGEVYFKSGVVNSVLNGIMIFHENTDIF